MAGLVRGDDLVEDAGVVAENCAYAPHGRGGA
jgi:hypothetical protein